MTRTKPRLTYTHRCAHGAPTQSARARAQVAAVGGRLHTCRHRTAPHACSTYLALAARITIVKSRRMCVGELLETLLHRRSTARARENQTSAQSAKGEARELPAIVNQRTRCARTIVSRRSDPRHLAGRVGDAGSAATTCGGARGRRLESCHRQASLMKAISQGEFFR